MTFMYPTFGLVYFLSTVIAPWLLSLCLVFVRGHISNPCSIPGSMFNSTVNLWKPRQWVPVSTIFALALVHTLNAVSPLRSRTGLPPHLSSTLLPPPSTTPNTSDTPYTWPTSIAPPPPPPLQTPLHPAPQETLGCWWLIAAARHHQGLSCCSPTELFHRSHPRCCFHFSQLCVHSVHPVFGWALPVENS